MKKRFFNTMGLGVPLAALSMFAVMTSCVKEEYDLNDLDTTIRVGGDSLSLPLASTQQLYLSKLLGEEQMEYIKKVEGDTYGFAMADTMDFSDKIEEVMKNLKIDPVNISQKFDFKIDDIDLTGLKIDKQAMDNSIQLQDVTIPEVKIDPVTFSNEVATEVWKYRPDASKLQLDLPSRSFASSWAVDKGKLNLPPLYDQIPGNTPIPLPSGLLSFTLPENSSKVSVNVKVELVEGISNVRDVLLDPQAQMEITFKITNPILQDNGSIEPDINLDVAQLLGLQGNSSGIIQLGADMALNPSNNFTATKSVGLRSLALDPSDWKGNLLDKTVQLSVSGKIGLNGSVSKDQLDKFFSTNKGTMGVEIGISFKKTAISNITMDITEINQDVNQNFNMAIDPVQLPEQIAGIKEVKMMPGSQIALKISSKNFSKLSALSTKMQALEIQLPEEIVSPDLVKGKLTVSPFDIKSGKDIVINVEAIRPSAPVNQVISFDSNVSVTAKLAVGGTVRLSDLPTSKADDPMVSISANTNLQVDDFFVDMNRIEQPIDPMVKDIVFDLPAEIGDLGTFTIYPMTTGGQPAITVDIVKEKLSSLVLATGSEGLKIMFPDMIQFMDPDPSYNFSKAENSITIKGEIPDHITLKIASLKVTPKKNADGVLQATGKFSMGGTAVVSSRDGGIATVSGNEARKFIEKGIEINAVIPAMSVDKVNLEQFSTDISRTESVEFIDLAQLPPELKELKTVDLKDTRLEVQLTVGNLPDMGATPEISLNIALPKEIIIDDPRVDKNNVLSIEGKLQDGKIRIPAIEISRLDLSAVKLGEGGKFIRDIAVNGSVSVKNPTVRPEDLSGRVLNIDLAAGIPEINISKVLGKVDYQLEDMSQSIKLEGLPDFVKGEDFVLDLANPHIELAVKTNVGLPVKGNIEIVSVIGTETVAEQKITGLVIPAAPAASDTLLTRFWLAAKADGMPSGYTFLEADLPTLLRRIPDKIDLKINAGTDTEGGDHVVEPSARYKLELQYDVVVPFEFGEDLYIGFSDTLDISATAELLSQILDMNAVNLRGSVTSALPLQLEMSIGLLDSKDNVIPTTRKTAQVIAACDKTGKPSETPLNVLIALEKGASASDLKSLKVDFKVTSANSSGVPVTEKSFVQAKIQLMVPGGITIDPIELSNPNNQK